METIQFKGKENLQEVQEFLNRHGIPSEFRVRKAFIRNGKEYPRVEIVNYKDNPGYWRVLTPNRWVAVEGGIVNQYPSKPK